MRSSKRSISIRKRRLEVNLNWLKRDPEVYWNPYVGGALLGLILGGAFILAGEGLGGSGGLSRVVAALTDLFAPRYAERNPLIAAWVGGDASPLNHRMVWMALGALIGGFLSGAMRGRVKLETRKGPRITVKQRWVLALLGGIITGFAARLARGCASGQALSGGASLSLGSWLFIIAVFGMGYILAYPLRRLWI
ncbi:YeeE/YedE family protein [Myxococcota bacterium]|nr:YeeE/YedE family protein [Myxococcota bacterium]